MKKDQKITPFLWFDNQAGEAAKFYTSIFKDARILDKENLSDTPSGDVQVYNIEIGKQRFTLMNAGPRYTFNEAISFVIDCENQNDIDYYWESLTANGGAPGQCGWLKDKFGVSWQVVPQNLGELLAFDKTGDSLKAMLKMNKIVIEDL